MSPYNPIFVVHLVKMGKLRRVIGSIPHLQKSHSEITEACDRIRVTFGRDSTLMGEAVCMLRDTEGELVNRMEL